MSVLMYGIKNKSLKEMKILYFKLFEDSGQTFNFPKLKFVFYPSMVSAKSRFPYLFHSLVTYLLQFPLISRECDVSLQVKDVACGYGFTLFSVEPNFEKGVHKVFGCGINTDSQIGMLHSFLLQ